MTGAKLDLTRFEGHTPGDWEVSDYVFLIGGDRYLDIKQADGGKHICMVMEDGANAEQDAALLAAATALLALARAQAAEIEGQQRELFRLRHRAMNDAALTSLLAKANMVAGYDADNEQDGPIGREFIHHRYAFRALLDRAQAAESRATALEGIVREVVGALSASASWFRDYQRQHEAKGTQDGADKAVTNAARASICEAAIARAEQALKPEGNQGWRLIDENTPRDGTPLLVGFPPRNGSPGAVFDAWWSEEDGGWVDGETDADGDLRVFNHVTHYQPLPDPPADPEGEG